MRWERIAASRLHVWTPNVDCLRTEALIWALNFELWNWRSFNEPTKLSLVIKRSIASDRRRERSKLHIFVVTSLHIFLWSKIAFIRLNRFCFTKLNVVKRGACVNTVNGVNSGERDLNKAKNCFGRLSGKLKLKRAGKVFSCFCNLFRASELQEFAIRTRPCTDSRQSGRIHARQNKQKFIKYYWYQLILSKH